MAAVTFDYARWAARFPELADRVAEPLAAEYFAEAGLYCNNSEGAVVADEAVRMMVLNLITAHIAALNAAAAGGNEASPIVGRISSASQGSISVQATLDIPAGSAQWWAQTRYGLSAWQALLPYRTMQYVPGRSRQMTPYGGYPRG